MTLRKIDCILDVRNLHLHLYYYLTYPLQATDNEAFAIIDYIRSTEAEGRPSPINKN
jgi:hypothetical protein